MYTEPKKVNKGFYHKGKAYYSEAEIMELGAFIAFHYGLQVFMRTIKAFPLHDKDGNLMTNEESRKYYSSK